MPYRLIVEVQLEMQPLPTRSVIEFDLPAGAVEADAKAIARGIRKSFRDIFDAKVKVVSFQQTGLTVDVDLPAG